MVNVDRIKQIYKEGTRVRVIKMNDPFPVEEGTEGTVDFVDDIGNIHCTFDNGRSLALVKGEDRFYVIRK